MFNPDGPDDEAAARERLAGWIGHWNSHGFGYEVIENRAGTVLGMAGIRHERWLEVPVLNLYYRLAPEAWGLGIASAAGRRALATAARVAPDLPVLVLTTPDNVPSRRTAAAIGLRRRPDLEIVLNSIPAIIFTSSWPTDPPGPAPSAVTRG